jgi:hypothetical protein
MQPRCQGVATHGENVFWLLYPCNKAENSRSPDLVFIHQGTRKGNVKIKKGCGQLPVNRANK